MQSFGPWHPLSRSRSKIQACSCQTGLGTWDPGRPHKPGAQPGVWQLFPRPGRIHPALGLVSGVLLGAGMGGLIVVSVREWSPNPLRIQLSLNTLFELNNSRAYAICLESMAHAYFHPVPPLGISPLSFLPMRHADQQCLVLPT